MKRYLLFVLPFFPFMAWTQPYLPKTEDSLLPNNQILLHATVEINSNALTNDFIHLFYQGGYISEATKADVSRKLCDMNRFGSEFSTSLEWRTKLMNTAQPTHLFCKLSEYQLNEMAFTKDLFQVAFYGNLGYEGKTAVFTNSGFQKLNYMQLKTGLLYDFPGVSTSQEIMVGLGINFGQSLYQIQIDKGELYTQPGGNHVYLGIQADVKQSDTLGQSLINGWGPEIDLGYQFHSGKNFSFSIQLENLGYIEWNSKSFNQHIDTAIHYRGMEVTDVFHVPEHLFSSSADSLKRDFQFKTPPMQYITYTPAQLMMTFRHAFFRQRLWLALSSQWSFFSYAHPLLDFRAEYQLSPGLTVAPSIDYGGYSEFSMGLNTTMRLWKNSHLSLFLQGINGLMLPTTQCGEGLSLLWSCKL